MAIIFFQVHTQNVNKNSNPNTTKNERNNQQKEKVVWGVLSWPSGQGTDVTIIIGSKDLCNPDITNSYHPFKENQDIQYNHEDQDDQDEQDEQDEQDGSQWTQIDLNRSQWIPMDPNESQWIPIDPNGS